MSINEHKYIKLLDYAINQGAARLQWVAAPDNLAAQKLYGSLEAQKSEWLFYSY